MSLKKILEAVTATAELTGTDLSATSRAMMAEELAAYPLDSVLESLSRCRKELRTRLTLAEVIRRIQDGRPGAEEAWASMPRTEWESAMLTAESAEALHAAQSLIDGGDEVAARMCFREVYERAVAKARADGIPVKWEFSAGWKREGRAPVLAEAVRLGRISQDRAMALLPHDAHKDFLIAAGITNHPLLESPTAEQEANQLKLAQLRAGIMK